MFNVGLGEIAAILVLGLLIFGPDRLPKAVQTVAGGLRRFRAVANDASRSLQDAAGWDDSAARQTLTEIAEFSPRRLAGSMFDDPAAPAESQTRSQPGALRRAQGPAGAQEPGRAQRTTAEADEPAPVAFDPDAP